MMVVVTVVIGSLLALSALLAFLLLAAGARLVDQVNATIGDDREGGPAGVSPHVVPRAWLAPTPEPQAMPAAQRLDEVDMLNQLLAMPAARGDGARRQP